MSTIGDQELSTRRCHRYTHARELSGTNFQSTSFVHPCGDLCKLRSTDQALRSLVPDTQTCYGTHSRHASSLRLHCQAHSLLATRSSHTLTCIYVVVFISLAPSRRRCRFYHEAFSFCQQAPPTISAFHTPSFCAWRPDAGPAVRSELLNHSGPLPLDLVLPTWPQPSIISSRSLFSLWHVTVRSRMRLASLTRYSHAPLEVCKRASRKHPSSCSGSALQPPTRRRLVWGSPQPHDRLWTPMGSALNPRRMPDVSTPCTPRGR